MKNRCRSWTWSPSGIQLHGLVVQRFPKGWLANLGWSWISTALRLRPPQQNSSVRQWLHGCLHRWMPCFPIVIGTGAWRSLLVVRLFSRRKSHTSIQSHLQYWGADCEQWPVNDGYWCWMDGWSLLTIPEGNDQYQPSTEKNKLIHYHLSGHIIYVHHTHTTHVSTGIATKIHTWSMGSVGHPLKAVGHTYWRRLMVV